MSNKGNSGNNKPPWETGFPRKNNGNEKKPGNKTTFKTKNYTTF